jgi:hypothetical protein
MATVNYFPEEKPQGSATSGGSSALGAGGGQVKGGRPSGLGSGFTNLNKYLAVNNNQGTLDSLAGGVAKGLDQGVGSVSSAANTISSNYDNDARNFDTMGREANADAAAVYTGMGEVSSGIMSGKGAGAFDAWDTAANKANQWKTTGPGQVADTTMVNAGRQLLGADANTLKSNRYAQQTALKDNFGANYGSGFGRLDSFLLGAQNQGGLDSAIGGKLQSADAAIAGIGKAQQNRDRAITDFNWNVDYARNAAAANRDINRSALHDAKNVLSENALGNATGEDFGMKAKGVAEANRLGWGGLASFLGQDTYKPRRHMPVEGEAGQRMVW